MEGNTTQSAKAQVSKSLEALDDAMAVMGTYNQSAAYLYCMEADKDKGMKEMETGQRRVKAKVMTTKWQIKASTDTLMSKIASLVQELLLSKEHSRKEAVEMDKLSQMCSAVMPDDGEFEDADDSGISTTPAEKAKMAEASQSLYESTSPNHSPSKDDKDMHD
jgi:hypothetical protein